MAAGTTGKRVLVSGATGMIGTELTRQLTADGHSVLRLVRRESHGPTEFSWDPSTRTIDSNVIGTVDAVINLSGASIGRMPWTARYKRKILASRIDTTSTLAEAIARSATPPAVLLNASAVGYYGSRPGETLTESSAKGQGFLSDVVEAWEQAAQPAAGAARVVTFRTAGLVVARGGAFTPLGLLTRFGLAARFGRGSQHWSWVSLHDEAAAIRHLLASKLSGAVNIVGPTGATSVQLTRALAVSMRRWHLLAVPEPIIRIALGDAGIDTLLPDQHIVPERLLADGFTFTHQTIESAIDAIWGAAAAR